MKQSPGFDSLFGFEFLSDGFPIKHHGHPARRPPLCTILPFAYHLDMNSDHCRCIPLITGLALHKRLLILYILHWPVGIGVLRFDLFPPSQGHPLVQWFFLSVSCWVSRLAMACSVIRRLTLEPQLGCQLGCFISGYLVLFTPQIALLLNYCLCCSYPCVATPDGATTSSLSAAMNFYHQSFSQPSRTPSGLFQLPFSFHFCVGVPLYVRKPTLEG